MYCHGLTELINPINVETAVRRILLTMYDFS